MNNNVNKMYWEQIVNIFALTFLLFCLAGASVVSFTQTYDVFVPSNDPNLQVFGFSIGMHIALFYAGIFQYGQNGALFYAKHFCKNTVLFKIGKFPVTDTKVTYFIFGVTAFVDAITNIIWFYNVKLPDDIVLRVLLGSVGYTSAILAVFVEEAFGKIADALHKAFSQFVEIIKYDRKVNNKPVASTQQVNQSQNTYKPNNNKAEQKREEYFSNQAGLRPVIASGKSQENKMSDENKKRLEELRNKHRNGGPTYGTETEDNWRPY